MLFPLWGATARYESFLALHVILIVPGTSRGFFVLVEKLAGRETFLEKGSPSPCPPFQKLLPVSLCRDKGTTRYISYDQAFSFRRFVMSVPLCIEGHGFYRCVS